jgi:hypothetical protein
MLSSVWGRDDELLAVGSAGVILFFDGTSWQTIPSGSTADLQGVWGNSMSDVFAAGPEGTVLHYTGSHWSTMSTPTDEFLRGIWGTSRNEVFVTGTRGTIIRYDGGRWSAMSSGSPNRLYAIWGSTSDNIFIAGHLGTILHYDGLAWNTMDSGARPTLWDVWGAGANDVFVVGGSGVILRYDGTAWSMMDSGTDEDLLGVWGISDTVIYAVGGNGTILRFDGVTWNPMESGTTRTLKDVFGTAPDNVVAVGDTGTILRYTGGSVPVFILEFDARTGTSAVELSWRTNLIYTLRGFKLQKTDGSGRQSMLPGGGGLIHPDARRFRDTGAVDPGADYRYTLIAVLQDGTSVRSQTIRVAVPSAGLTVEQNHPNPFNPSTRIVFSLPETTAVRVDVYDASGRHIVALTDATLPAGSHHVEWNGRDAARLPVASGVYFCRIDAGNKHAVVKMTLAK